MSSNRPNGHQIDSLVKLYEHSAEDWASYAERHPTVAYTDEWARRIASQFATIMEGES